MDTDDEDAARVQIIVELNKHESKMEEHFEEVVRKELSIFSGKDEYNYAQDLKSAYHRSLATTTEQKILDKIPDYIFWDIKTPQMIKPVGRMNRYNPYRGREFNNFFDMRASETYMDSQMTKDNINPSVSLFRQY